MSVASTTPFLSFVITALPQALAVSFPFNLTTDLLVTDGAVILTKGSDYTVTGGGYNVQNQLQPGTVTVVAGGAGNVQVGDTITITRNVTANQTTSFASTGIQTPLMIEADDDKLTTLVQQIQQQQYNPFPLVAGSPTFGALGWITAQIGGTPTTMDSLNVNSIPLIQLPLFQIFRFTGAPGASIWQLRPMTGGDPSTSVPYQFTVPVSNANNLIWEYVL